ncbi:ATP-binding protein [Streptomyces albipurpureus]|uniref:ATP-binding protein n=1 Tax=Streptomyces albipurpureus TaxID=2897419 RepID=A0ABT0UPN7_9ACTN|nr:ATP-binding protein [Streptomyces sp. CWNU-1]MCM2390568.1 ATP-binding protein [Streptomyces sp. CWNU-1]
MTTHVSASANASTRYGGRLREAAPGVRWPLGLTASSEQPWGAGQGVRPAGFAACGLDGQLRNAPQARRFLASTLDRWALQRVLPDAGLVVSELVTNAVQHALEPGAGDLGEYPVWLGIFLHPDELVCAVTDPSSNPPCPRDAEASALGGRGLALISALSRTWSWSLTPPRGKTVWATLSLQPSSG